MKLGQQAAAGKDWTAAIREFKAGQAIPDEGGGDLPVWQQLRSELEGAQRGKAEEEREGVPSHYHLRWSAQR